MSHLFSSQNFGRNNIVSYKDTVYKSRAGKIFKLSLLICCILGILLGAAYALSDLFLPGAVGYGTAKADGQNALVMNETVADTSDAALYVPTEEESTVKYATAKVLASDGVGGAEITGVTLNDRSFTYDGTAKALAVEGTLPEGAVVTYYNNEKTDAGSYEITAEISCDGYETLTLSATLTIEKAKLNQIVLNDTILTYDGLAKTIAINNSDELPDRMTVTYTINDFEHEKELSEAKNVGKYWITATIAGNENYETLVLRALLTIEKADIIGATLSDASFVFDGTSRSIYVDYDKDKYSEVAVYYTNNGKSNAGDHTVTATLSGSNYNTLTLTAVISIAKATIDPNDLHFTDSTFVYNGFGFIFSYKNNTVTDIMEKSPTLQHPKVNGVPATASVDYEITSGDGVNAGNHTVKAVVSGSNYENTVELTMDYTIEKADITGVAAENASPIRYNEKEQSITAYLRAVDKFGNVHHVYDYTGIVFDYSYEERVIPGEHGVRVTLSGDNYNTYVLEETLTIIKGLIDTSNITTMPTEFTYNGYEKRVDKTWFSGVPEGVDIDCSEAVATGAGTHRLSVTLTKEYYEDCTFPVTMVINKGNYGGLRYFTSQIVFKPLNADSSLLPEFEGNLTEGTTVKYMWNGSVVDGLNRLGEYSVDVTVYDANREADFTVDYWILPNPWLLLIGLAVGIAVGILIAILALINRGAVEKSSKKHFGDMNGEIASIRGGIICESRVKMFDGNSILATKDSKGAKNGRLYLTRYAVEYYDENYEENYRNFLIRTSDILSVDTDGCLNDKLIICSKGRNQVFNVPAGTADLWRREILHFKNVDQAGLL